MTENELFNKLEEIVCSAPIGGVKYEYNEDGSLKTPTIKTLSEIFSDMTIKTLVNHLMENGVEVK